ncbi:MAG: 3-deoxy-7-phosphoheptulonate synthase [Cytophagales bacterium]|nr:3-deoxy-7-phosphoheptulonate synthase [Cytophagales bacterium]
MPTQSNNHPLIIAGPCSAESEEQLLATASALKKLNIDIFRAGVWKPRTRPDSFEGVGSIGLTWLKNVKKVTGLPTAVEVAKPVHIEEALKNEIDILWIGARTTVNPFIVQELAEAMKGADIKVMVKNPINPDLSLWIGAIERIQNAGIKSVAAVHRGFSSFDNTKFKNTPTWQIPIELKRLLPDIPLICDPSHISGKRALIFEVAQKALDLDYDGLMIETHIDPNEALSDKEQQVTPDQLKKILGDLKIRKPSSDNVEFINQLEELRSKIDNMDRELLETLTARMAVVEKIGKYKKEHNVTILQVERWREIFKTRPQWAKKMNLNEKFIAELYKLIHDESIRKQTGVFKSANKGHNSVK